MFCYSQARSKSLPADSMGHSRLQHLGLTKAEGNGPKDTKSGGPDSVDSPFVAALLSSRWDARKKIY